eukprot:1122871-Prymnesium_polylepis.1
MAYSLTSAGERGAARGLVSRLSESPVDEKVCQVGGCRATTSRVLGRARQRERGAPARDTGTIDRRTWRESPECALELLCA